MTLKGNNAILQYCGWTENRRRSAMVPSDRALATFYRLSIVTYPSAAV